MKPLNVVILPNEQIQQWIVNTSKQIHETYASEFIVDNITHIPHISLYQSEYPETAVSEVVKRLTTITASHQPFRIELASISTIASYLFCDVQKTKELLQLHSLIVHTLNPLRDPLLHTRMDQHSGFPDYFFESTKKYGYALALEHYQPHITITAFSTPKQAQQAAATVSPARYSSIIDAVYLANIDHHGTVTNILEKFPFQI